MNTIQPSETSSKSLIWSFIISIFLAIIILLVAVFPAEYNIDPTGLGKKMGLTALAIDTSTKPVAISCPETESTAGNVAWKDTVSIVVPAKKGLEYKLYLTKGEQLGFSWNTDGAALYFDFHGEPEGDTTGYFKSYKVSTENKANGSLQMPFTGVHGWYWENKSNQPVTVILKTKGNYRKIGIL
jgi:hypothetical protein